MIETRCLKNVAIFIQTILSFVLPRKITLNYFQYHYKTLPRAHIFHHNILYLQRLTGS